MDCFCFLCWRAFNVIRLHRSDWSFWANFELLSFWSLDSPKSFVVKFSNDEDIKISASGRDLIVRTFIVNFCLTYKLNILILKNWHEEERGTQEAMITSLKSWWLRYIESQPITIKSLMLSIKKNWGIYEKIGKILWSELGRNLWKKQGQALATGKKVIMEPKM